MVHHAPRLWAQLKPLPHASAPTPAPVAHHQPTHPTSYIVPGAARLLFLCGVVGAGSTVQAFYRRVVAPSNDAHARLDRGPPSAQAAVAQAAARRVMQALGAFLCFACLLVGSASLANGGPLPPSPSPPPPPPPPSVQWRAAGLAKPEPSRAAVKTPKTAKTPKTSSPRRRPTAYPRDHHHKTNRQGSSKASSKEKSVPRAQTPYGAPGQTKSPRARKRGDPATSAV